MPRILFITGTDTGVGKTVLTALLLAHLRQTGVRALALKPFCSGTRADARTLYALQNGELRLDEVNPFSFTEPVAPLVAARKHRRCVALKEVLAHIQSTIEKHLLPLQNSPANPKEPVLLIEGCGGLLVPLGKRFTVLDLITELPSLNPRLTRDDSSIARTVPPLALEILVVARNKLGVLNHTLLTVHALRHALSRSSRLAPPPAVRVVLMSPRSGDASSASNFRGTV